MRLVCPNDEAHARFIGTAHVTEDWVLDPFGQFLEKCKETFDAVTTHRPDEDDVITCETCGAEAIKK